MSWAALALGFIALTLLTLIVLALAGLRDDLARLRDLVRDILNTQRWAQEAQDTRSQELEELRSEVQRLHASGTEGLLRQRVVANLADGSSIRGLLTSDHPEVIVLEHAEYLNGRQPESFAGRAVLPRTQVLWFQAGADD